MNQVSAHPSERRAAKASLLPLAMMVVAFFVPSFRACKDDPLQAPVQLALEGLGSAALVVPVFAVAALLAVLTALALARGSVGPSLRRAGLAALALFAASSLAFGTVSLVGDGDPLWLGGALGAAAAAAVLLRRGRGRPPWRAWEHLLASFAVLAAATPPVAVLANELARGHFEHLGPGAYLFLGAELALGAICAAALVRDARGPGSAQAPTAASS